MISSDFFKRSKSAETDTILKDEPFRRTMSSVEALGLRTDSEWDANSMMMTANDMRGFRVVGEIGQHKVDFNPNAIKRAKQEANASPYTKVLCRFNAEESEVPSSFCSTSTSRERDISDERHCVHQRVVVGAGL